MVKDEGIWAYVKMFVDKILRVHTKPKSTATWRRHKPQQEKIRQSKSEGRII